MTEGIHLNIPESEYRKAEGVNQSTLKEMLISPAHYLAKITQPPEPPTDAQIIGTITHRAILQNKFDEFCVKPKDYDGRTKEGKAWIERAKEMWGKTYTDLEFVAISIDIYKNILGMVAACRKHPVAKSILESKGDNEVSCLKMDEQSGLLLKGRADRLTTDAKNFTVVADLKTVQHGEGNAESFAKSIFNWGYDFQAAFYLDLFAATYFVFIVVEKEPPFAVACYNLSPEAIGRGRKHYRVCLERVQACMALNEWPAYGDKMTTINLPEWALRSDNA